MSSHRRPWFKWYPKEFMLDARIMSLSADAELLCRRMIDLMALSSDYTITGDIFTLNALTWPDMPPDDFGRLYESIQHPGFSVFTELPNGRLTNNIFQIETAFDGPRRSFPIDWREKREATFCFDNYTCQYCGARNTALECDHIIPHCKGGSDDFENLITACQRCNRDKNRKMLSDWMGANK